MVVSAAKSWFYIWTGESLNLGRKQEFVPFTNKLKSATCTKLRGHMHLLPYLHTSHTYAHYTHTQMFNSCIVNNMKGDEEDVTVAPYFGSTTFSLFCELFQLLSPSFKSNSRQLTSTLYVVGRPLHYRHLVPQVATRHEMLPK